MSTLALALSLLAPALPIDVFPGDPAALQAAVDAAAPGSTILVHGGTYDPITITKPLDIVAEPKAFLAITPACPGITSTSLVRLAGLGSGRVTLNNFGVSGAVDGFFYCGEPEPLLVGGGFEELWLIDSTWSASWCCLTGAAPGAPAISTSVPAIVVSGSTVAPLDADTDFAVGWPSPVGINAPNSTVVVTHSSVRGGSYNSYQSPGCGGLSSNGAPAAAIACDLLFQTGSEVTGGAETTVFCSSAPLGSHPQAPDYDANIATDIFANLTPLNSPLRGNVWELSAEAAASGGILLVSLDTAAPVYLPGFGWDLLSLSDTFLVESVPAGFSLRVFPIPNDPVLVGLELGAAMLDLELSLFGGPVITQIR